MIEIKDYTPKCFPHIVERKYGGYAELAVILSEFSYKLYLKFLCDRLGVGGAAYLGGDRLLA